MFIKRKYFSSYLIFSKLHVLSCRYSCLVISYICLFVNFPNEFNIRMQSALLHSQPKSTVGTPAYIAPEVLSRKEYDGKVLCTLLNSFAK